MFRYAVPPSPPVRTAAPPRGRAPRGGQQSVYSQGWTDVGPYRRRLSVTLDASGNGQVQFDVRSSNQRYVIEYITVSTTQAPTTAPYPTVTVYEGGAVSPGMSEGATWTGNQDTFKGRFVIDAGTDLIVRFTGGVVGSIATVVLDGTNQLEAALAASYGY